MIIIFTRTRFLVLKALPKGREFNQDYILEEFLPSLSQQKSSSRRKEYEIEFLVYMDKLMCYNARKISLELEHNKIERALTQLILPTSARVTFGCLVFPKKNLRNRSYGHLMKLLRQLRPLGTMSLLNSCRACCSNGFNEYPGSLSTGKYCNESLLQFPEGVLIGGKNLAVRTFWTPYNTPINGSSSILLFFSLPLVIAI
jgi:hypothetical protein